MSLHFVLALRLGSNAKAVLLSNTSATSPINEDTGLYGAVPLMEGQTWRRVD